MPTTYAHYKFGKEVLSALPRPLQNSIEAHRELFDIGLHGPDILFYYNALKKDPVNEQGHTLHEQFADEFFHHAVEVIEKAKDPAVARAYIYGFICHFALDSECHPYVEKIKSSGLPVPLIEYSAEHKFLCNRNYKSKYNNLDHKIC